MLSALAGATPRHAGNADAPLPKAPVLGWDSFWPPGRGDAPNVGDLPHRLLTTSGRAALHLALLQMGLPAGSGVLVPTYHCPTMVAPIIEAGLSPVYYSLVDDGTPDVERIELGAPGPRAMVVAHFFGLARSLAPVRAWCDARGILMIEDCAHCYFGQAGERPIGSWGDYATASLTKFFPVAEAGLLASATRALTPAALSAPGVRAQLKSAWDVVHHSRQHGRLAGLSQLTAPLVMLRERMPRAPDPLAQNSADLDDEAIRASCDMGRIRERPSIATRLLLAALPAGRIAERRRHNYAVLAKALDSAPHAHVLQADPGPHSAPYVLPLVADDPARADAVYARLRAARMPVFRWDRLWPGTPRMTGDMGHTWSRELLQLLCHQDLSDDDLVAVAAEARQALAAEH